MTVRVTKDNVAEVLQAIKLLTAKQVLIGILAEAQTRRPARFEIDQPFPSGDDAPPGHPHCRCLLVPAFATRG